MALDYAYLTKDGQRSTRTGGRAVATHDILTMLVVPEDVQDLCGNGSPSATVWCTVSWPMLWAS